jgi:DsbC/DsbD-like thiol-disulfide interchange protein
MNRLRGSSNFKSKRCLGTESRIVRQNGEAMLNVRLLLIGLVVLTSAQAQDKHSPVKWSGKIVPERRVFKNGDRFTAVLNAKISPGWHLYSISEPSGGAVPTSVTTPEQPCFKVDGVTQGPPPNHVFDLNFNMETDVYLNEVAILLPVQIQNDCPSGTYQLQLSIRFQACSARSCTRPTTQNLALTVRVNSESCNTHLLHKLANIRGICE